MITVYLDVFLIACTLLSTFAFSVLPFLFVYFCLVLSLFVLFCSYDLLKAKFFSSPYYFSPSAGLDIVYSTSFLLINTFGFFLIFRDFVFQSTVSSKQNWEEGLEVFIQSLPLHMACPVITIPHQSGTFLRVLSLIVNRK